VISEERIEQLAYEWINDSDGTLGALQNALRNAAEESDRAARQEWQPIETAPKDCLLIVSDCRSIALAHIVAGDVWTQYVHGTPMLFQPDLKFKPSHWMPLPEATIREEIHRRKAMERKNGVAIRHQPECLLAGEINDGSVVCGCKSKQGFG
jgi:hypothetical protein